jgi:hypothetical protein
VKNKESNLFIKAGYDAIVDDSRSINTAIINDREPNQIIFLKRNFDIEAIYNLKDQSQYLTTPTHDKTLSRKWISLVLDVMDDKIKEHDRDVYYTVKGRRATIVFEQRDTSYRDNLKIGQKRHKAHKKYDDYSATITINTEYGDITTRIYEDDRLETSLQYVKDKWEDLLQSSERIENYQKWSKARQKEIDDKQKNDFYEKQKSEKQEKNLKRLEEFKNAVKHWNNKLNTKVILDNLSDLDAIKYIDLYDMIDRKIPFYIKEDRASEIIEETKDFYKEDVFLNMDFNDNNRENVYNMLDMILKLHTEYVIPSGQTMTYHFLNY